MSKKIKHTHLIFVSLLIPLCIGALTILTPKELIYYTKKVYRKTLSNYERIESDDINFTHAYGVMVPKKFQVHGIDVSRYQKNIDWQNLSNNFEEGIKIQFAFIKVTEGENFIDEQFNYNWLQAKKNGIIRGAYHFFHPKLDPKSQAKHFLASVKLRKGDLPPVLDVEIDQDLDATLIRHQIQIWLDIIETYYNRKPIIYTNYKFFHIYLNGFFDDYPIWLAHYNQAKVSLENGREWTFWQYSEKGRLQGIEGDVDLNAYNGDFQSLQSFCF